MRGLNCFVIGHWIIDKSSHTCCLFFYYRLFTDMQWNFPYVHGLWLMLKNLNCSKARFENVFGWFWFLTRE